MSLYLNYDRVGSIRRKDLEHRLSGAGSGIVESVVLGLRVGIALFDVNNVKFAFIVLPKLDVERCTSLRVVGPIRKRPSERLKNFVDPRISGSP
jgi:hypothetical protein